MTGLPGMGAGSDSTPSALLAARAGVVRALEWLERSERDALDGLHDALCSYVSVLKRAGEPPEKVIAEVTELVSTPATPDGAIVMTPTVRAALVEIAVDWCKAAYGRDEPPTDSPTVPSPPSTPTGAPPQPPA